MRETLPAAHHVGVRHPRPDRGAGDERPNRGDARGTRRTARYARADLPRPGELVRGRLRGPVEPVTGTCTGTGPGAAELPESGASVQMLLRPEALRLVGPTDPSAPAGVTLDGRVTEVVNEGSVATVVVRVAEALWLRVAVPDPGSRGIPAPGGEASVVIPPGIARALPS